MTRQPRPQCRRPRPFLAIEDRLTPPVHAPRLALDAGSVAIDGALSRMRENDCRGPQND